MQLRVVNHLWLRLSSGNLCNPKQQAAKHRYMKWWAFSDHFFLFLSSNFVQLNFVPGIRIFVGRGRRVDYWSVFMACLLSSELLWGLFLSSRWRLAQGGMKRNNLGLMN